MAERRESGRRERTTQGPHRREPSRPAEGRTGSPASAHEALERARQHGRRAAAEALCAVRALLDAGSLAATGLPSEAHRGLARVAGALEEMADAFGTSDGPSLVVALVDALDAEIGRWEQRAADNPDARAVLRAFLGLRELLWELGVRRPQPGGNGTAQPRGAAPATRPDAPPRRGTIQRVPLEG